MTSKERLIPVSSSGAWRQVSPQASALLIHWAWAGIWIPVGNGTPLQYCGLENPMDGGAWWAAVHGVAKNRTRLSDFTFTFHFHASEKEMATHSSVLAWRIPWTEKPGRLQSMGSHRVGHDWSDLAAEFQESNHLSFRWKCAQLIMN